uniref:Secreted protein n=1 Tax=Triticum urartu TaxID=4572 RepID=A0A8R7TFX6_TRIUA
MPHLFPSFFLLLLCPSLSLNALSLPLDRDPDDLDRHGWPALPGSPLLHRGLASPPVLDAVGAHEGASHTRCCPLLLCQLTPASSHHASPLPPVAVVPSAYPLLLFLAQAATGRRPILLPAPRRGPLEAITAQHLVGLFLAYAPHRTTKTVAHCHDEASCCL